MGNKFFTEYENFDNSGIAALQNARRMKQERIKQAREEYEGAATDAQRKAAKKFLIDEGELDESANDTFVTNEAQLSALRGKAMKTEAKDNPRKGGFLSSLFSSRNDDMNDPESRMVEDETGKKVFDWAAKAGEKGYSEQQAYADKGMKKFSEGAAKAGYKFDENGNVRKWDGKTKSFVLYAKAGTDEAKEAEKKGWGAATDLIDRERDTTDLSGYSGEDGLRKKKAIEDYRKSAGYNASQNGQIRKALSQLENFRDGEITAENAEQFESANSVLAARDKKDRDNGYSIPTEQERKDFSSSDNKIARDMALEEVNAAQAKKMTAEEMYRLAVNQHGDPQAAWGAVNEYLDTHMAPGAEKDLKRAQVLRFFRNQHLVGKSGVDDRGEGAGSPPPNQRETRATYANGDTYSGQDIVGNYMEYAPGYNPNVDYEAAFVKGNTAARKRYIDKVLIYQGINPNSEAYKDRFAEYEALFLSGVNDPDLSSFRSKLGPKGKAVTNMSGDKQKIDEDDVEDILPKLLPEQKAKYGYKDGLTGTARSRALQRIGAAMADGTLQFQ